MLKVWVFILLSVVSVEAVAGSRRAPSNASSTTPTTTAPRPKTGMARTFYTYEFGILMWQEPIKATRAGETTSMESQSLGIRGAYTYHKPFHRSAFRQSHAVEVVTGMVKAKGKTFLISDELENQPFISAAVSPGITLRTTAVSEVGLFLPLTYRLIQWQLKSGSGLKMDKDSSYSAGVTAAFISRFTPRTSLSVSLTRQHMWDASIWALSFQQVF